MRILILFTDINQLDITNHDKVAQIIENNNINYIINCAAYTSVDKAEKFTELADQINNKAVENFAKIAKKIRLNSYIFPQIMFLTEIK